MTIFVRLRMNPVYKYGLAFEEYLEMIDKKLYTLFTFTASGSGWIINDVKQLDERFAAFHPKRGSSYITLPNNLQPMDCLLNIRVYNDHNCCIYCFVAAWLIMYGPSLQPPSQDMHSCWKTNPKT